MHPHFGYENVFFCQYIDTHKYEKMAHSEMSELRTNNLIKVCTYILGCILEL